MCRETAKVFGLDIGYASGYDTNNVECSIMLGIKGFAKSDKLHTGYVSRCAALKK